MNEDDQSNGRRVNDADVAVLQEKQRAADIQLKSVSDLLSEHVTGCAKLQKWVLGVLLFIAGWTVAHSPEAMKLLTAVIGAL